MVELEISSTQFRVYENILVCKFGYKNRHPFLNLRNFNVLKDARPFFEYQLFKEILLRKEKIE